MARKYVPKTRKLRRTYNKNKRRYAKRSMLSFTKAPMPNKFATKLRYHEAFTIDPGTAGFAGTYVISHNGLTDPNITGSGHQPRGFDQIMPMYDHYTVIGSKITVTFTSAGIAGSGGPLLVGIACKDSSVTSVDVNDYMEGRNVVSRVLNRSATSAESHSVILSKHCSTKKFLGISAPLANTVIRGDVSGNPAEQAYYHLFAAIVTGTADAPVVEASVVIDYLVVFSEPKQPSQS